MTSPLRPWPPEHHRRRTRLVSVLAVVVALLLVAPTPSSAAEPDPAAEQAKVREEMVEVATKIDTSKATLDEIDQALATLDGNAASQQAALAEARADLATARAQRARAEGSIKRLTDRLRILRLVMRERAVRAFVHPPVDDLMTDVATGDYLNASKRSVFISLRATSDADLAKAMRSTEGRLRTEKAAAQAAEDRAADEQAKQEELLASTEQALADRHDLFQKLRTSLDELAVRTDQLATTDRALTDERVRLEEEAKARAKAKAEAEAWALIQSRLLAERAAPVLAPARLLTDTPATTTVRSTSTTDDGWSSGEQEPLPAGAYTGSRSEGIYLCDVSGITVNCVIARQLQAMIDYARLGGLTLTGGGYRNPSQQIALRRAHCGGSYYAIYQAGASSCSPPTARPGTSQHEVGLAIDFAGAGTRSTSVYQWLALHAAKFGFYNLPSEAWHWSTSGS